MRWFRQLSQSPEGDFSLLVPALEWFAKEYGEAKSAMNFEGQRLEIAHKKLPGQMMYYYEQVQELEAIMEWLDVMLLKATQKARRFYTEGYPRQLSDYQVNKWAEADPDVIDLKLIKVEVALSRNRHLGITKALEQANFQLGHINHLRRGGIEDATL